MVEHDRTGDLAEFVLQFEQLRLGNMDPGVPPELRDALKRAVKGWQAGNDVQAFPEVEADAPDARLVQFFQRAIADIVIGNRDAGITHAVVAVAAMAQRLQQGAMIGSIEAGLYDRDEAQTEGLRHMMHIIEIRLGRLVSPLLSRREAR